MHFSFHVGIVNLILYKFYIYMFLLTSQNSHFSCIPINIAKNNYLVLIDINRFEKSMVNLMQVYILDSLNCFLKG